MKYFNIDPDTKLAVAQTDMEVHPNAMGIMGHWLPAEAGILTSDVYCQNDTLVPLPPRPGLWAIFDHVAGVWFDPRSVEEHAARLVLDRAAAVAQINSITGKVRLRYVTDLPGQDALYLLKEGEARRWLTSVDPSVTDFPLIAAEIGITGTTAHEVAQVYANLSALYVQAAARLETVRLYHISLAETAASGEAARTAAEAFGAAVQSAAGAAT